MEGAAMTSEVFTPARRGIGARFGDMAAGAREMARAALQEAMRWNAYQWTVLALLTATFILVALSYGGIRSELAALKQERGAASADPAAAGAETAKHIADLQAVLVQAISEAKTGLSGDIAKIGAKLDARSQAKPPAPAPKPAARR
jgi:hypothetical protein